MLLFSKAVQAFSLPTTSSSGRKRKHQVGNCLSFPLLSWQIYMQPHTSFSFPFSPSAVISFILLKAPCFGGGLWASPFDTGGTALSVSLFFCLHCLPLYSSLLSAFVNKHVQISRYYSFFPLWLEATFLKKVLSSEILSSLTCQDLYTVYNKLSSVFLKRLVLSATNLLTWKMIVTVRIHVL